MLTFQLMAQDHNALWWSSNDVGYLAEERVSGSMRASRLRLTSSLVRPVSASLGSDLSALPASCSVCVVWPAAQPSGRVASWLPATFSTPSLHGTSSRESQCIIFISFKNQSIRGKCSYLTLFYESINNKIFNTNYNFSKYNILFICDNFIVHFILLFIRT